MNIEELRDFCLSLGDVTEKTPFGKFARRFDSVLAFYICGHIFCMTDLNDFSTVTLKSTLEEIEELKIRFHSIAGARNPLKRDWIEVAVNADIPDREIRRMIKNSYAIVRAKHTKNRRINNV